MIFDWKFKHADRKWIYTATTRVTNMAKVLFYRYEEEEEQEGLLDKFLEAKVERYKHQDREANRDIENDNDITAECLKRAYGSSCGNCGDCLTYTITDNKVESNLTAQRLNNEVAHQLENVFPFCKFCNCVLSNRDDLISI